MLQRLPLVALVLVFIAGCADRRSGHLPDIRAALLASAAKSDPDFPDGRTVMLTHFSHVGQLSSATGVIIYVADRRSVIAGMQAARGQNYITFFDARFRYLGKVDYSCSRPLWCEDSRLFLFGDLDGANTALSGNVLDVAKGFDQIMAYHSRSYGSSGDAK